MADIRETILEGYPAKVFKNRKDHIVELEGEDNPIEANRRSIPGIITSRGCCYAGCKGVVLGPIKDIVLITHGPIGCGYYSWLTRRNKARPGENGLDLITYSFSTDMQESDIVFGGVNKLAKAIDEAVEIFHPKAVFVCATCPVGLIGDDINAVAAAAQKRHGVQCISFSCEGYKGVSQSAGHHIANNQFMKYLVGSGEREVGKFPVNILGEYNIGGDAWEIERILKKIGYDIVCTYTGDANVDDLRVANTAKLSIVQCHRSINYIAEMIETKYGVRWMKVNFIGIQGTIDSLRNMAKYFGDADLIERTEQVIAEEYALIDDEMSAHKERLKGRTAAIYVGGSRSHHYQIMLKALGISTIMAGYEFGHREDYEGRKVLPFVKEDADSKNIESITVAPDEKKYHIFLSKEKADELAKEMELDYYDGMFNDMNDGNVAIDDLNHYETEMVLEKLKPDIFFSGIKDKFVAQKRGVLSRQLHSYDYSGPYAGFTGALNFARDVDMGVHTPTWLLIEAPWKKQPMLVGEVLGGQK
ncbi:MAG: nitrogenase component I subunit alpha [Ethanoligenens sp.]